MGSCLGGCSPECCCSLLFMCCLRVRRASLRRLCYLAVRFVWFLISDGCYRNVGFVVDWLVCFGWLVCGLLGAMAVVLWVCVCVAGGFGCLL